MLKVPFVHNGMVGGASRPCPSFSRLIFLDQAKAQKCLVKRRRRVEARAAPSLRKPQRGVAVGASHVPHEVLGGLLGVPLLALLAGLHLGQQRLPVRLV